MFLKAGNLALMLLDLVGALVFGRPLRIDDSANDILTLQQLHL